MKTIEQLITIAEDNGWSVTKEDYTDNQQVYLLSKSSPCGQDFNCSLDTQNNDAQMLVDDLGRYVDNYDCSEEAYLWLDSSGHGKNGAPYEMCDVYDDMVACKEMMQGLLAEWRTALVNA